MRERPFAWAGSTSEGFAGLRRLDSTVNLALSSPSEGLALLAGIAACVRDSPGQAEVRYGTDRRVETVYLLGHGGKRRLGRWYDKGLESGVAGRGLLIRGEDQRRWGKGDRRDPSELTAEALRSSFRRRFLPLYKATKGVKVAGLLAVTERIGDAVAAGEVTPGEGQAIAGEVLLSSVYGRGFGTRSAVWRRRALLRKLGAIPADGVLEMVEVDVAVILEAALDTDAWERRG